MEFSFEGIGQMTATFAVETEVQPGMVVALTEDSTVGSGTAGDLPCGVILTAKNGMAAVQIGGMVTVGYTGTAPDIGYTAISVDGNGGIQADEDGTVCLIVSVNTADSTAVIKL